MSDYDSPVEYPPSAEEQAIARQAAEHRRHQEMLEMQQIKRQEEDRRRSAPQQIEQLTGHIVQQVRGLHNGRFAAEVLQLLENVAHAMDRMQREEAHFRNDAMDSMRYGLGPNQYQKYLLGSWK